MIQLIIFVLPFLCLPRVSFFQVVSLFCDKCGVEEVFIIPPCCIIRYHYHCVIEYVDSGFTTCPQCRRPLQNNLTALADNQGGGDGGGGDGEGGSENMEGDQGDPGGGGDDDDDGGDGSAGGSPLPPVTPYDETFRQILLACMTGYLLADDGDEEENYEPMVDDQGVYKNSGHFFPFFLALNLQKITGTFLCFNDPVDSLNWYLCIVDRCGTYVKE